MDGDTAKVSTRDAYLLRRLAMLIEPLRDSRFSRPRWLWPLILDRGQLHPLDDHELEEAYARAEAVP